MIEDAYWGISVLQPALLVLAMTVALLGYVMGPPKAVGSVIPNSSTEAENKADESGNGACPLPAALSYSSDVGSM
jgi:hypothetical protein